MNSNRLIFPVTLLFLFRLSAVAQPCHTDMHIVKTRSELEATANKNSAARFVRLRKLMPEIVIDLRYATANNFTGRVLYHNAVAYMRQAPAEGLRAVQQELKDKGLGLKIFDAYRPYSVTCEMWHATSSKRYVANPRKGSHHNRGTAVDLTLVDLATGRELDMGTGFDNFTDSAHHGFTNLPAAVLERRSMLKRLMWKHGFSYVPTEWWHYHWRDKHYDLVDLPFADLEG